MATPRKTAAKKVARPTVVETPPLHQEASSVSSWKKPATLIPLPSGNAMRVRVVGLRAFLTNGVIPNSLMAVVQSSLETGTAPNDEELVKEMMGDPEKLADFMSMLDAAVVFSAVEPRVFPEPADEDERSDERLYADELDEADKMAIFAYATSGTVDAEPFRS